LTAFFFTLAPAVMSILSTFSKPEGCGETMKPDAALALSSDLHLFHVRFLSSRSACGSCTSSGEKMHLNPQINQSARHHRDW
jgi:hypothetical protein